MSFSSAAAAQTTFNLAALAGNEGRVAGYSFTAHGDVEELIPDDGTKVFTPPYLGSLLVQFAQPDDPVVVHSLHTRAISMVQAPSLTNTATRRTIGRDVSSPSRTEPPRERSRPTTVSGIVREQLHGPCSDLNGVLLDDGAVPRLPQPEVVRSAARLQPGMLISTHGLCLAGPFGRVVAANAVDRRSP